MHNVGQPPIDPEDLLKRLKEEHQVLQWEPLPPTTMAQQPVGESVRNRTSLNYLHHNWALPDTFDPADAGAGPRGRLVALWGKLTFHVLRRYLREERDLIAHMVRVNEGLEQRCDELSLRVQQLRQDMVDRQVADAKNMTKLALWLQLDPPPSAASTDEPVGGAKRSLQAVSQRESDPDPEGGAATESTGARRSAAQR